jgi:hypothetical protein
MGRHRYSVERCSPLLPQVLEYDRIEYGGLPVRQSKLSHCGTENTAASNMAGYQQATPYCFVAQRI